MKFFKSLFYLFLLTHIQCSSQPFSKADSLRGSLNENRTWWNVLKYDLNINVNYNGRTISGYNKITYAVNNSGTGLMQIDLQEPMILDSAILKNKKLSFNRNGNAYLINMLTYAIKDQPIDSITLYFHGKPHKATLPPWDGGWIWKKDDMGRPWISVACQGLGASIWYPCKDHQSDEPDNGASITITVPDTLMAVANGRLINQSKADGLASYTWTVTNPINNYNIVPYIGKYININEQYKGEKGNLDCNYWVLDYNVEKARKQFEQVPKMLKAFEYWFGPYPFYEDGYKIVEAPHLGMEHQSAIAYGNSFKNGYLGKDLSQTGEGLKWDYIIVHESGHEWFGNNITTNDIADMWVHEAFTDYSETLFLEYWFGKVAADKYLQGLRSRILNDKPIIGAYGVNNEGSQDMYFKGANIIHTIRQCINNDMKFRQILKGLNKTFYHQTVNTDQIENYISKQSGIDFSKFFDQYLRTNQIPTLLWYISKGKIFVQFTNCIKGFKMLVQIPIDKSKFILLEIDDNAPKGVNIKLTTEQITKMWNKNFYINYIEK